MVVAALPVDATVHAGSRERRRQDVCNAFFLVDYFALPVLVGYAPKFMAMKVIGQVNLAYLFALSQFFVAWIIAALYVKAANNFDRLAKDILDKTGKGDK